MTTQQTPTDRQERTNSLVLPARLMWFVAGPAILFIILVEIVINKRPWFSWIDGALAATVILTALGRWYEQHSGQGTDTNGEPTTEEDCARYILRLFGIAVAAWVAAHLAGTYLIK